MVHIMKVQPMKTSAGNVAANQYVISGARLGSLTPIKLAHYKSYTRLPDREAAKLLIEKYVNQHGADKVNSELNKAQAIN